jgi:hypothetical protein
LHCWYLPSGVKYLPANKELPVRNRRREGVAALAAFYFVRILQQLRRNTFMQNDDNSFENITRTATNEVLAERGLSEQHRVYDVQPEIDTDYFVVRSEGEGSTRGASKVPFVSDRRG